MSSFGEDLKRERELRQISLREVAEATKINLRYLDALENNDFRHLPGGVFNKGFVRAFSEFIGIDPEAMVNAYLLEERSQEDRAETVRAPVAKQRAAVVIAPAGTMRTAVVVALVLTAALVAAGLLWYWLGRPSHAARATSAAAPPAATAST